MSTGAAKCKSCGASVYWAMTERGKAMPVDADPNAEGNLVLDLDDASVLSVVVVTKTNAAQFEGRYRHTSHFVTCPEAKSWRRS